MPSFLRLCGCTLLLAAYSSVANPTSMQFDNPASIEARGGVDMLLNPLGTVLHPLEMALTNGQRMARGLPLNKPTLRRAERSPPRPRASPIPSRPNSACSPHNGVVHVTSIDGGPTGGTGPSPHLDGYLSQTLNEFGEFGYTTERAQALRVTIDDCQGAPFDLLSSNGLKAFPFVGGIKGYSSDSANLSARSFNYVYIGGVTQTAPNSTPQGVPNAFTAATEISEVSESAIWSFRQGSILQAQWVNTNGATPPNTLVYVPSINVFVLTGDVGLFETTFENVSLSTFTFESS